MNPFGNFSEMQPKSRYSHWASWTVGLGRSDAGVSAATDPCVRWWGGAVMFPRARMTMPEDISGWQNSGGVLRWRPETT